MDRAAPPIESLHALELRVSEGPQSGARAPLGAGIPCVLAAGHDGADGADIVLREDKLPPARVRICAELTQATLEVLAGEVLLGSEVLKAGAQTHWSQHVPLQIGSSVVAFGRACIDDWTVGRPTPGLMDEPVVAASNAEAPAAKPLRRRAEFWLACMGAGVLVACGGALAMARGVTASPAPQIDQAVALSQALRASEFSTLEVARTADGRLALRGRLTALSQRAKLDAWLAARPASAPLAVEVTVDEALAREVTEVFRVNGIAVQADVAGPGRVAAQAAERDADKLARVEEVVRRDVRGLRQLTVRNTAKPLPPPPPPVIDDPGKRIASLVPGETAYLVTADGSRYFVGAMLPTGHRITRIEQSSVTLERDGQLATLRF
jgi:type III secretion protein D